MNKNIFKLNKLSFAFLVCGFFQSAGFAQEKQISPASPPAAPAAKIPGQEGFIYTANEREKSVSVIDVGTGVVSSLATRISPHNVQASQNGKLLLVIGPLADETAETMKLPEFGKVPGGRLLIIDTRKLGSEGVMEVGDVQVGRTPGHVILDAGDTFAYVTNSQDNTVSIVDLARKLVVGEIKTGAYPDGLGISPDGKEIYVANVNDNSVSIVDVGTSAEVLRLSVGQAPKQVAFTPDGRLAYVSLRDENKVAVVGTGDRKVITTIRVGHHPVEVFASPDGGRIYVANRGLKGDLTNTVSVIETATNTVIATVETGKGAHAVVVSPDGKKAFVTNTLDETISEMDTATLKVTRQFKVGKAPNGITFGSLSR